MERGGRILAVRVNFYEYSLYGSGSGIYGTERAWLSGGRGDAFLGVTLHEIIHFVWFHVWNQEFRDSYEEYERPSLKWILSEMVVESIMTDPRPSELNPYFPREDGG